MYKPIDICSTPGALPLLGIAFAPCGCDHAFGCGEACCASQVLDRGAQAVARGGARCFFQVLYRGAKAAARGAASCASHELRRGAQAAARSAVALPQQEKNNSVKVQRNKVNIAVCICTVASKLAATCL
jgi:hypothetical protein